MKLATVIALSLLSCTKIAAAQALPELFSVSGVGKSDNLNIRSEPSASSSIIGTIAPDQKDIEVVAKSPSGAWYQVNDGERSGWVYSKFLTLQSGTWQTGKLPNNLTCRGTEPFWSAYLRDTAMTFKTIDEPERKFSTVNVISRNFEADRSRVAIAKSDDTQLTAVVVPAQCNDGMSDGQYALTGTFIFQKGAEKPTVNYGCCTIAP